MSGLVLPDKEFRYLWTIHLFIRPLLASLMVAHEIGLYLPRRWRSSTYSLWGSSIPVSKDERDLLPHGVRSRMVAVLHPPCVQVFRPLSGLPWDGAWKSHLPIFRHTIKFPADWLHRSKIITNLVFRYSQCFQHTVEFFNYNRHSIVIAVVHWRFGRWQYTLLHATSTVNVPAPDKRHPVYSAFRLSTELCFW